MAGYIGSKTVNLSTTGADIAGDADVSGDLTVDTNTLHVDSTNNRVGIGTSLPSADLDVASSNATIHLTDTDDTTYAEIRNNGGTFTIASDEGAAATNSSINFRVDGSEAMRLDASGNLLLSKTSSATNTVGVELGATGYGAFCRDANKVAIFNRKTNAGTILDLQKDGSSVGVIGVAIAGASDLNLTVISGDVGLRFRPNDDSIVPINGSGSFRDNAIDLGLSNARFDDIYATNGTIQTSDRNEKQDIAELSDAEQRVAVAAKGLMRKFRWRDAVEAKGDAARTHFGIIAQDLQAAFAAEGLDAGDYAMLISTTWWETQTEVPAVEAVAEVLDEDGNVVTEAVEAADAYTRTDTYDTQEEAPEGATERTRLGVRYGELLAFIIGAL